MKKLLVKVLPAAALALTLCLAIAMLAACSKPDVVFSGDRDIMSIECHCVLTLKADNTCTYEVTTESEMQTAQQIVAALSKTGTWKMENDQYVVTLGEGESATTVTSTSANGVYSIVYGMQGRDGVFEVTLKTE